MTKTTWLILLVFPLCAVSQDRGIHFEHGLTWQQVKAKAKAENKYIFIDCYATWCGPCKMMSNNVFPQKEAGDFFNAHFINVKLQLDTTAKDNADVKAWYADGNQIAKKYAINVFPTFLFFNPNGEAVHRIAGASGTAAEFITLASDALDSTQQYYTLIKKYKNGYREPAFLRNMAMMMLKMGNDSAAMAITSTYLATQKDMFTKENIQLISMFTRSSSDNGFKFFLNNAAKIDSIAGDGVTLQVIKPIITQEEIYNKMANNSGLPQWDSLRTNITTKYPLMASQADRMIIAAKIMYYSNTADWKSFAAAATDYMKAYGDKASPDQLNNLAWDVFVNCTDTVYLNNALEWSRLSLKSGDNPVFIDTYANLLYRLGRKEEALTYEEKAVALAGESNNAGYKETLSKMKNGETITIHE